MATSGLGKIQHPRLLQPTANREPETAEEASQAGTSACPQEHRTGQMAARHRERLKTTVSRAPPRLGFHSGQKNSLLLAGQPQKSPGKATVPTLLLSDPPDLFENPCDHWDHLFRQGACTQAGNRRRLCAAGNQSSGLLELQNLRRSRDMKILGTLTLLALGLAAASAPASAATICSGCNYLNTDTSQYLGLQIGRASCRERV